MRSRVFTGVAAAMVGCAALSFAAEMNGKGAKQSQCREDNVKGLGGHLNVQKMI